MDMQAAINAVINRQNLTAADMATVMQMIMTGEATSAQIAGFLVGLRMKGETVEEIAAAAQVMRELAQKVAITSDYLVDTCGTGGDATGTFNISTASAFVVAAAGAKVAKHGNRSVSSKSGSADVLEAAGVNIELTPEQVVLCVQELGVGFMFAPRHHNAMKFAIGPRREMGVRTLFNLLGPLTNPAGAPNQVLGVFSDVWREPLAQVLARLGSRHVLVVHAEDGLDEISIAAPTRIAEYSKGQFINYTVTPEQFGISRSPLAEIVTTNAQQSLAMIRRALDNTRCAARDVVALNAGAAIYAAGLEPTFAQGVTKASEAIASGAAQDKLDKLIAFTAKFA